MAPRGDPLGQRSSIWVVRYSKAPLSICQISCRSDNPSMRYRYLVAKFADPHKGTKTKTRHRASTRVYSLTFCVRVVSPERHHWKPAVQAAAVMLRTPPSTVSHRPASHAILRTRPVTRQSPASSARTPRRAFALCRHIAGWTQTCN